MCYDVHVLVLHVSVLLVCFVFFFSSRRPHTRLQGDWSSDVCSSDLGGCRLFHVGVTGVYDTHGRERTMRALTMRSLVLGALLGAGLYAQNQQPPKTHLKEGDMAPDFTLTATTGGKVMLSDFRGKSNVVLAFFPAAFTGG